MPTPPLQISGKDLGALALKGFCPRCFWISRRAKLPWQIFPGIFSSIDSYSKKVVHGEFDKVGAPGWLAPLGELKGYKDPPSAQKFRVPVDEHGILLTGAPDAIFERADATLVIADYKTSRFTPHQDRLLPVYRVKWVCIMLNEFLPVGGSRRAFAGSAAEHDARKAAQLVKARAALGAVVSPPVPLRKVA